MKEIKKRNYLLDNLKVVLIFFVVFGHVIEYYIKDNSILRIVYVFIYIFHMPLFIFISGYFSKNFYRMKRKAIRNLLIPYITFNMIWYTAVYIGTKENMFSLLLPGWTLWYLLSLFFWRIFLKYIVKFKHMLAFSFFIGILIGLVPSVGSILSISRTIVFLPFFPVYPLRIISLRLLVLEIFQRHPPIPAQGPVRLAAVGDLQVGEKHPLLFFVIQIDVRLAHAAPSFPD